MLWRIIIFWLPVSYVVPALLLLTFEDFLTRYKFYNENFTSSSLPPIYWIICTIIFVLLVFFFEFRKKNKWKKYYKKWYLKLKKDNYDHLVWFFIVWYIFALFGIFISTNDNLVGNRYICNYIRINRFCKRCI